MASKQKVMERASELLAPEAGSEIDLATAMLLCLRAVRQGAGGIVSTALIRAIEKDNTITMTPEARAALVGVAYRVGGGTSQASVILGTGPVWWLRRFREVGYISGLTPTPSARPKTALTAYKGATALRRAGMSWTDERSVAERYVTGKGGRVYVLDVPPSALLAHLGVGHEEERVLDPNRVYRADQRGCIKVHLAAQRPSDANGGSQ